MSSSNAATLFAPDKNRNHRMVWGSLLCTDRLEAKTNGSPLTRSDFEIDYDRLIFSKAFRRLARKTQVHPLAENDHTHNRLTHSLEVASVGRSLGKAAFYVAQDNESDDIPADANTFAALVQAACLAHDIGNTPFGHAGERAIRDWLSHYLNDTDKLSVAQRSDLTFYEGNAQAFRLATRSVNEFEQGCDNKVGGIGLTAATLATMMKYPWHSDHGNAQPHGKYSVFQDDLNAFDFVTSRTGLLPKDNAYCRHPLAFLVEAADDICNAIIDIEDALDLAIIKRADVEPPLKELSELASNSTIAQMRSRAISVLIEQTINVFSQHYHEIMEGSFNQPLITAIDNNKLSAFKTLNAIAVNQIYPFEKNDELDKSCKLTLANILNATTLPIEVLSLEQPDSVTAPFIDFIEKRMSTSKSDYERFIMMMDFVAGMTDNYAVSLATRLERVAAV